MWVVIMNVDGYYELIWEVLEKGAMIVAWESEETVYFSKTEVPGQDLTFWRAVQTFTHSHNTLMK